MHEQESFHALGEDILAASSPVLVGRDRELAYLEGILRAPAGVVVVEGEAGVGKSRLVQEAVVKAVPNERRMLFGQCPPLRQAFLLGPVIQALATLSEDPPPKIALNPVAGALTGLLPELSSVLPSPLEPLEDPHAETHRLFRGIAEVLRATSAILVIEDAHWADERTLDFISFLASSVPENVLLVVTYRPHDMTRPLKLTAVRKRDGSSKLIDRIVLKPLQPDDVGKLISSILGTDEVSREFASFLHDRTAGLPFAVEELLQLLIDRRSIRREDGYWTRRAIERLQVPHRIRDFVQERLDVLDQHARSIVRAAAVLAEAAEEPLLATVAGLRPSDAAAGVRTALSAALLVERAPHRYSFRHDLARQAVYETVQGPDRREMHLRAGTELAKLNPQPAVRLAHHFRSAGDLSEWVRWAEEAAERAVATGAHRTAYTLLKEVVDEGSISLSHRARLAKMLGVAAGHALLHDDAMAILKRIIEQGSLEPADRGSLRCTLAAVLAQGGDDSAAYRAWERAVSELEPSSAEAARAMMNLSLPGVVEGTAEDHLEWARRAVEASRLLGDADIEAAAVASETGLYVELGDPSAWARIPPPPGITDPLDKQINAVPMRVNLAVFAWFLGHYHRAEKFAQEAQTVATNAGYGRLDVAVRAVELFLEWSRGQWDGLEDRAADLIAAADGYPLVERDARLVRGLVLLAKGDSTAAEGELTHILESGPSGWIHTFAAASGAMTRLSLSRGEVASAAAQSSRAVDVLRRKKIWTWSALLAPAAAEALLASGAIDEADELGREIESGLQGRDAPAPKAALLHVQGLVMLSKSEFDQAVESLAEAEKAWQQIGSPYAAALVNEVRGLCLVRSDAVGAGESVLATSLRTLSGLGASWDAARIRQTARAHGLMLPYLHRGGRQSYGEGLSPREADVLRLARSGHTNREIAAQLFLSVRTVESHIARVLRKLDLSSKRELRNLPREAQSKIK